MLYLFSKYDGNQQIKRQKIGNKKLTFFRVGNQKHWFSRPCLPQGDIKSVGTHLEGLIA